MAVVHSTGKRLRITTERVASAALVGTMKAKPRFFYTFLFLKFFFGRGEGSSCGGGGSFFLEVCFFDIEDMRRLVVTNMA